ncbi:response regulator [Tamlana sp. 2201CG12-4]|uniref:response regulator n=1 Tax=Tamlana sp. 2201CG12-4 TaxID=3112582 RepID=UPI002DB6146A|nr:response regulator [Tamlana sp. 2201CG12-4]MEC3906217.1 response regulator [Tamlana sp. 2201CG12-4]
MNVLLVEDHPLIVNAYENALRHISFKKRGLKFKIDTANDCDTAYAKAKEASKEVLIDIVFLDIQLPSSKDGRLISGEDLGIKIKDILPNAKVIVATTYNDNYRVNSIFKSLNPDGFLIKNDLNPRELVKAIESVIKGTPYYSKSVVQLMRKQVANGFSIDTIDRKMLFELSRGARMSELPEVLPLSLAALEKRKRVLKQTFNIVGKSDRKLLKLAEEKGFI